MKVLIGTTNASKINRFKEMLKGYDIEFYSLNDLNIVDEPLENGKTPLENAVIKAKFYGHYFEKVICNDSGLYFKGLDISDRRQPGLNIRTPNGCKRLDDEEMIDYYSNLVKGLGGEVKATYLDGMAVYNQGEIHSYIDDLDNVDETYFYIIDKPSDKRHPGWPLDSISLTQDKSRYFVDKDDEQKENVMIGEYANRLRAFLLKSLGINE